jgi:hypothetical protein
LRPAWANSSQTYLQNNQSKIDWKSGSSGKAPVSKHKALSSNPRSTERRKERKREEKKEKRGRPSVD